MAFTYETKNTSKITAAGDIEVGMPIGLLLTLTYASADSVETAGNNFETKNSSGTFTFETKNTS